MIDNTQRNLLFIALQGLQRWRNDAWETFQSTGDRRCHTELLAADEAVAKLLMELRDLTMGKSNENHG